MILNILPEKGNLGYVKKTIKIAMNHLLVSCKLKPRIILPA